MNDEQDQLTPVPWHFKVMVGLAVVYVGWRVVQMIGWGIAWLAARLS